MAEARRSDNDAEVMPTDALKEAGQQLLSLLAQRATQAASDRVTDLSGRLTGIADNGGTGVLSRSAVSAPMTMMIVVVLTMMLAMIPAETEKSGAPASAGCSAP
jgi:hypothetical protein